MREGPDISRIAALIGDPARAQILTALMSGKALTPSELAQECGLTAQTISSHISQLVKGGLATRSKQGRHVYVTIAEPDVADFLETLMGLAAKKGHLRTRTGPKDPALRHARVCYKHLAGDMGVQLYDALRTQDLIRGSDNLALTEKGRARLLTFGMEENALSPDHRIFAKPCLDWSMRKPHLGGRLGVALLDHMLQLGWAKQVQGSRVISFTSNGQRNFATFISAM